MLSASNFPLNWCFYQPAQNGQLIQDSCASLGYARLVFSNSPWALPGGERKEFHLRECTHISDSAHGMAVVEILPSLETWKFDVTLLHFFTESKPG